MSTMFSSSYKESPEKLPTEEQELENSKTALKPGGGCDPDEPKNVKCMFNSEEATIASSDSGATTIA